MPPFSVSFHTLVSVQFLSFSSPVTYCVISHFVPDVSMCFSFSSLCSICLYCAVVLCVCVVGGGGFDQMA